MSRLIDADALLYVLETVPLTDDGGVDINDLEDIINRLPTIDAVPMIRCKDCKHYDIEIPSRCIKDRCYCAMVDSFMKTTDYCSYGERKRDADMV